MCVCLGICVSKRMRGSGGLWQGDGLRVLCHAFSNQPTATIWGWRKGRGTEEERDRGEEQRKAILQKKTKERENNEEK